LAENKPTTEELVVTEAGAREALDRVPPTTDRSSRLVVPSSHATGGELDSIEMAIDHPPPKADHFGTALAVLGAAALIAKTIASPIDHLGSKDLSVIILSSVLGAFQFLRYWQALTAPTPIKKLAKQHIRQLKLAQGWQPPPPSNWEILRAEIWRRTLERFGIKREEANR